MWDPPPPGPCCCCCCCCIRGLPAQDAGSPSPRPGGALPTAGPGLQQEGGITVAKLSCDGHLPTRPARGPGTLLSNGCSRHRCVFKQRHSPCKCACVCACVHVCVGAGGEGDSQVETRVPSTACRGSSQPVGAQRSVGLSGSLPSAWNPGSNNENRKAFICCGPAAGGCY